MDNKSNILDITLEYIKGVGPAKAELLKKELKVFRVRDLLTIYPFRYVDRTKFHLIKDLKSDGDTVQLKGKLVSLEKIKGKNNRFRLQGLFKDSSGFIELIWFQGAKWLGNVLKEDHEYVVYGKLTIYKGKKNIAHPEMELLSDRAKDNLQPTFDPVYSSTEKLDSRGLDSKGRRGILKFILGKIREEDVLENIPDYLRTQLKLCTKFQALHWIHFPKNASEKELATNRLKFEELFYLQLRLLLGKETRKKKLKGADFNVVGDYFNTFYKEGLKFELTGAQKRVIKEIRANMGSGVHMNRLLQGDVGSGKTVVGFMSMLLAKDNGYQACMMAPTEILAQQHYAGISELAFPLGLKVGFLSGSVKGKKRQTVLENLKLGEIDILIGTHALIEDPVVFKNLGLAIIDEQHRFGVAQRAKLWKKNTKVAPHVLVMTATPIPRTLAMTVYGDLDVSIIDEMPPGRKLIQTVHQYESARPKVINFMRSEIDKGRQIYVVFPLIEESAKLDLKNLNDGYERLLHFFPMPTYQMSILHGRMKPKDKDFEMDRFVKGVTQIMVATTVIEVGVNVPNASVMIIENTERFGLSQLHQLRGRVGRGSDQSYCILMTGDKLSKESRERIGTMVRTNNGFEIAEADLRLRGPGDIEGTMQSGIMDLKLSSIVEDSGILNAARYYAQAIIERDGDLQHASNQCIKSFLQLSRSNVKIWGRIS
ncbi:MAG: ATP-dependent DNA helicase RecG [Saprospiraceae bacterium]|nr:ATP-dependent DNA helicase RecG [Saprospiraceae bacterium]